MFYIISANIKGKDEKAAEDKLRSTGKFNGGN